jgi:flagellar motor switch protein FliG
MQNLTPSIRKAAVLVSTLDERAAEAVLAQMGDEMAARVRSAVVELDEIPAKEQQSVLAEFFAGQASQMPAASGDDQGVELDVSPSGQVLSSSPAKASEPAKVAPFSFLHEVPPRETARRLAREGAQTIAAVMAQLDPHLAAQLLEALPADLATAALERMASLDNPSPDALAEIADQLRRELLPLARPAQRSTSLAGMHALLAAMDETVRDRVLNGLRNRNVRLADQLENEGRTGGQTRYRVESLASEMPGPAGRRDSQAAPLVEFEDLLTLSDEALRRVFAAADSQIVLLALTGAPESLLARILCQLPPGNAATLRKRLNCPGPVRLSDIAAAQEALAAVARGLAESGVIVLPGTRSFAAAA